MKYIPNPKIDLLRVYTLLSQHNPFVFIRFSDGETEILKNRYLEINDGVSVFRGIKSINNYPVYDTKLFDPSIHINIYNDLLLSAKKRNYNYFIGIPTSHNGAIDDRDLMVGINGGLSEHITFADLFTNSNYLNYRRKIVPLFNTFVNIIVIANFRSKLTGVLSRAAHIPIQDNFFSNYDETLCSVMKEIFIIPKYSLVLSSASSLSNILGMHIHKERPDLTFLDIGTTLNDLLSLDSRTRSYHILLGDRTLKGWIRKQRYRLSLEYKIKW
jgi:hypothetical protein